MASITFEQLLKAGAHFGHQPRKWNPAMAPYIFMERNNTHIIDLHKTVAKIEESTEIIRNMARNGKKILFVATKKQVKEPVEELAKSVGMPYVVERWPGGMLTNFLTIRKAVNKMGSLEELLNNKETNMISKRERLQITREKGKLEKNLGSIANLKRLPAALFIVDINKEHIAVAEARRLNIPTFAMVDTNCNPDLIDFPIPANDDASKSIELIVEYMCSAIEEGKQERKLDKESRQQEEAELEKEEKNNTESSDDEKPTEVRSRRVRKTRPADKK